MNGLAIAVVSVFVGAISAGLARLLGFDYAISDSVLAVVTLATAALTCVAAFSKKGN